MEFDEEDRRGTERNVEMDIPWQRMDAPSSEHRVGDICIERRTGECSVMTSCFR